MIIVKEKDGIALITALLLSLIVVIFGAAVFTLILTSTRHSGNIKRYTSSLEATKGGMEDFISTLKSSDWTNASDPNWITGHICKLRRDTNLWASVCNFCTTLTQCTSNSDPSDIINFADWKKNYGSYTVYAKIIDCKGYTDGFIYNFELVGVANSTNERTWIQVVYQQMF